MTDRITLDPTSDQANWKLLAGSLGLVGLVAFLGTLLTKESINTWYVDLVQPEIAPPNWVFGPVWTLLYVMIGISFYLVLRRKPSPDVIVVFIVQLSLNLLWSGAFFALQSVEAGLIVISVLVASIVWTIVLFYRIRKVAGVLLIPYLLWVIFAMYLNYQFYILN